MKVRFQVSALNAALSRASIVTPRPITPEGGGGFLFVVEDNACAIYSREQHHQIRVNLPIEEADGNGAFVFPSEKVAALKYLEEWVEIESGHDKEGDRYWVKYEAGSKDAQEVSTVDPRTMQGFTESYNQAKEGAEFSAVLLKDAITTTKTYMAKAGTTSAEENFQTIQVFDESKEEWKKGDGYMLAADGIRLCYFYCEKLKGKGLTLHARDIPFILPFLSKCKGDVRLRHGKSMTYLVDKEGDVLGLAHNIHTHGKFSYYPLKNDQFILQVDKEPFVKALRYVRAALDSKRDKVRIQYTHTDNTLQVLATEGVAKTTGRPVVVVPVEEESGAGAKGSTESFATNVNLNHLIELVDPMRSHQVKLRVAVVSPGNGRKEQVLFRTLEAFHLDDDGEVVIADKEAQGKAVECQVTRFMPSRS